LGDPAGTEKIKIDESRNKDFALKLNNFWVL
jgi:hypothetical protein